MPFSHIIPPSPSPTESKRLFYTSVTLKSLLMKVKEENEKAGLKFSIQNTRIMASSPITSWQIDGETMKTVRDFIFLGSKITADGDCNHETEKKNLLLLGRKAMTNLDSILKSRDITLLTKVCLVKAMVFPVVMYGCESWTIKKAGHSRIFSNTTVQSISPLALSFLYSPTLTAIHDYWKNHSFD